MGIIILFLQIMKLRHSFQNLPEQAQQIIWRIGVHNSSIWPWSMHCLIAEYMVWLVHSCLLLSFLCFPVGRVSFPTLFPLCSAMWLSSAVGMWGESCLSTSFKDTHAICLCFLCTPFLCYKKTRNRPGCVSLQNAAPSPWVPNKKTHGAKRTHRIDPQSPSSPLIMWTRNKCVYSETLRFGDCYSSKSWLIQPSNHGDSSALPPGRDGM